MAAFSIPKSESEFKEWLFELVRTLDAIIEVLDDGTMPPQQMVELNPDAALSDTEKEALKTWAETTADALLQ